MKRRVHHHNFMGKRYEVDVEEPHDGICDEKKKYLIVSIPIETKKGLTVLVHECLHACYPNMRHDGVEKGAESIGGLLWKLGYRKKK